jgi:hypothetical protein
MSARAYDSSNLQYMKATKYDTQAFVRNLCDGQLIMDGIVAIDNIWQIDHVLAGKLSEQLTPPSRHLTMKHVYALII